MVGDSLINKMIIFLLSIFMCLLINKYNHNLFYYVSESLASESASLLKCAPFFQQQNITIRVASVLELQKAIKQSVIGTTILIANGQYALNGIVLLLEVPNVTIRSASGNREDVVLDGGYKTHEILQIMASNITIADITLKKAYDHPIHVISTNKGDTVNTRIYNVHIIDPGEQAVKINPGSDGYYTDKGEIACSHIELTDEGRSYIRKNCYTGGIDAHQSRGWVVRDNVIEGFWCPQGLSEHAVHFWRGSRDTVVENNILRNNARAVGFGMATSGKARQYADDVCSSGKNYVDHFEGIITGNSISFNSKDLFKSFSGADCGICLWQACKASVDNNLIQSTDPDHTFSSIEWRFPMTRAEIRNNTVNVKMRARDGASAVESGNSFAPQRREDR